MKYEIINPSDKCFIYADDVRLAKIVCSVLGEGIYGLKDETGESVMYVFEPIDEALSMNIEDIKKFINDNVSELSKVFLSLEYQDERTSLNNIKERADHYGKALAAQASERGKDNEG